MNLFDAEVRPHIDGLRVTAEGIDAALGIDVDSAIDSATSTHVIAGIRPERLRITSDISAIRGQVTMVENLGSEELVHVQIGDAAPTAANRTVVARAPRPAGVRVGDAIGFAVDPTDIHLFDPATGLRLTWQRPPSDVPLGAHATAAVPVP
ncbi:TOBE domain-containing protein [Nocardia uniformis]